MILDTNERFTICRPENLQGWLKERTNGIGDLQKQRKTHI